MPDFSVPVLNLPSGHSSETETSYSARSATPISCNGRCISKREDQLTKSLSKNLKPVRPLKTSVKGTKMIASDENIKEKASEIYCKSPRFPKSPNKIPQEPINRISKPSDRIAPKPSGNTNGIRKIDKTSTNVKSYNKQVPRLSVDCEKLINLVRKELKSEKVFGKVKQVQRDDNHQNPKAKTGSRGLSVKLNNEERSASETIKTNIKSNKVQPKGGVRSKVSKTHTVGEICKKSSVNDSKGYSSAVVNYRERKSVSQIDLKESRRSNNYLAGTRALIKANNNMDRMLSFSEMMKESIREKKLIQNAYWRMLCTLMLNSYRKRRAEVKNLLEENKDLQMSKMKTKNQLHVYNSLFSVEQRRTEDLRSQLHKMTVEKQKLSENEEQLVKKLKSSKSQGESLKNLLEQKENENEELCVKLEEVIAQLARSAQKQCDTEALLTAEQQSVLALKDERSQLLEELANRVEEIAELKQRFARTLIERDLEVRDLETRINSLLMENEKKSLSLAAYADTEKILSEKVELMEAELLKVRKSLDLVMAKCFKRFWRSTKDFQRGAIIWLHWLAFYMLPATPPPSRTPSPLPFALTFQKALSIVRR